MAHKRSKRSNLKFDFSEARTPEEKHEVLREVLSKPYVAFEEFDTYLQSYTSRIGAESVFSGVLPDVCLDFEDLDILICDDIGNANIDKLFENPTSTLAFLLDRIGMIFNEKFIGSIQDKYPFHSDEIFKSLPDSQRASLAAVCTMIRSNNQNLGFFPWITHNMIPLGWAPPPEYKELVLCGVFEKYRAGISSRARYWAVVDGSSNLDLFDSNGNKDLHINGITYESSGSGNSIRVKKGTEIVLRLNKIFDHIVEQWMLEETPLSLFFPYSTQVYPKVIIDVFHKLILNKDTMVLRAILDCNVIAVNDGKGLISALFAIFSNAKLVHRLIATYVAIEFSSAHDLNPQTVLRSNSHLTNVFKFFALKFGKIFFQKNIIPLIKEIEERKLKIRMKEGDTEPVDQKAVGELVNKGITKLVGSINDIPDEFRHLASLLKNAASTRLGIRHGVYNALSGFFCLRFFTAAIATPQAIDPSYPEYDLQTRRDFIIPYADLIQKPFNMQPIPMDKYPNLQTLASEIPDRYTELYNFVIKASEIKEEVLYAESSEESAKKGTEWILGMISKDDTVRRNFIARINDINDKEDEKSSVSFSMAEIVMKMFTH